MESILTTIKKLLGIEEDDNSFDLDIIVLINSALSTLFQLGVGEAAFSITDDSSTWNEYFGDREDLELIKEFIFLSVKVIFDPPTIGGVLQAYRDKINELTFRINCLVDPGPEEE